MQTANQRNRKRVLPSIVGKTYAFLSIEEERGTKRPTGKTLFEVLAVCVCGAANWVEERSVRRGSTTSCGRCALKTHGASKTKEYAVWRGMLGRCKLPSHKAYVNYGGRGITVCPEWQSFENFFSDMGAQPFKGASIDRIANDLGYCKENCRWATSTQQNRNRRSNRLVTAFGQTKPAIVWAYEHNLRHNTLCYRLDHGWEPEKALTTTPNFANRHGEC